MKRLMKNIWSWLCGHKDWAHFLAGFLSALLFGLGAAICVTLTSEMKDMQWGGQATANDIAIMLFGGLIGEVIHLACMLAIFVPEIM